MWKYRITLPLCNYGTIQNKSIKDHINFAPGGTKNLIIGFFLLPLDYREYSMITYKGGFQLAQLVKSLMVE